MTGVQKCQKKPLTTFFQNFETPSVKRSLKIRATKETKGRY